jgi:hypothetical protein
MSHNYIICNGKTSKQNNQYLYKKLNKMSGQMDCLKVKNSSFLDTTVNYEIFTG